jgi:hypothetical protein
MSFKPVSNKAATGNTDNADRKPFVAIIPEDGLQAVQVGLIVNLGQHKKLPKFAKDNAGKREQDESGADKVIWPKEGKDLEQRVAVYVDLLSQTHDYEGDIGIKNIRLPLHPVSRGMSEGINFTTVAPRTPEGEYIKGKPWSVPGSSQWAKIAAVTKIDDKTKVSDVMMKADYKNNDHNNIQLLLGKPFMFDVQVKVEEKGDSKYVNTKLKSPVPLMKGMSVEDALIPAISINFDDDDLLEVKDELGGVAKFDLLRLADVRKIVLAADYQGSKMQEAVKERFNEAELIEKAQEIVEKIIDNDKELKEINELYPQGKDGGEAPAKVEAKVEAEAAKPKKPSKPQAAPVEDEDCPF